MLVQSAAILYFALFLTFVESNKLESPNDIQVIKGLVSQMFQWYKSEIQSLR